jgi:hypothetical protein
LAKDRRSIREKIQNQMEVEDRKRKNELFRKRLELARNGAAAFKRGDRVASMGFFMSYIRILEEWKDVPEGSLGPEHFDRRRDRAELLLISGVYWDLVKIYDRAPNAESEFRKYLQKYVQFSRGMDFERVAAETLRKFYTHEKPVHKQEFKNAYESLTGNKCFVVGSLGEFLVEDDLNVMRTFRDQVLLRYFPAGVRLYYRKGPSWAEWLSRRPRWIRRMAALGVRCLTRILRHV